MGGNPFAITSDELLKRKQGVSGAGETNKPENTQETREAKETEKLKSTDVYSLAGQNGGSMATTDGKFENYDGFTRSSSTPVATQPKSKDEKDGESLLDRTFGATGEAKTQKSNCQDYQQTAKTDENFVKQQVNKQKQAETKTRTEINSITSEKEQLRAESDGLKNEVDSLNSEIASLMAEDGQTYTPQEAVEEETPQPQASSADTGTPTGDTAGMTAGISFGGDAGGGAAGGMSMGGGMDGGAQTFAMNSLPSSGGQEYAPTSETGVSAQNNANKQQDAAPTQDNKKSQGQQQGASNKAAGKSAAAGNSLQAFGNSLVKPKGKNADKINELLDQVNSKNSTISSNSSTISSLTAKGNQKTDSFQAQLKAIMNQTVTKKSNNTSNHDGAKTAQTIGSLTTTTGGLATATGSAMLAFSFGTNQLGTALIAGGGVATAAGSSTSAIASATQGDIQGAINTTTNGMNSFTNNMNQVRQLKQENNT